MPPAARISDMHTCPKVEPGPVPHVGGPVSAGASTVFIGYQPAARVGDSLVCFGGPPDSISQGEGSVLIEGQQAARMNDPTSHGGVIVAGCPTVLIGSSTQALTIIVAARKGTPLCEQCEKPVFNEHFLLVDDRTGTPILDRNYRLETSSSQQVVEGVVGEDGRTQTVSHEAEEDVTLHLGLQTKIGIG